MTTSEQIMTRIWPKLCDAFGVDSRVPGFKPWSARFDSFHDRFVATYGDDTVEFTLLTIQQIEDGFLDSNLLDVKLKMIRDGASPFAVESCIGHRNVGQYRGSPPQLCGATPIFYDGRFTENHLCAAQREVAHIAQDQASLLRGGDITVTKPEPGSPEHERMQEAMRALVVLPAPKLSDYNWHLIGAELEKIGIYETHDVGCACERCERRRAVPPGFKLAWPDPTPEMLADPLFTAIWEAIKTWDINVPHAYSGYCGATGNHARAIYDALVAASKRPAEPPAKEPRERPIAAGDRWAR